MENTLYLNVTTGFIASKQQLFTSQIR